MAASLWEALGCPAGHLLVPLSKHQSWQEASKGLSEALHGLGPARRFSSWQVLWQIIKNRPAPRSVTWAELCHGHSVEELSAFVKSAMASMRLRVASWSARWLCDPLTKSSTAERAEILDLAKGFVVSAQETHWHACAGAQREIFFPACKVIASLARPSSRGGLQGGVALILPSEASYLDHQELFPGCCLGCTFLVGGTRHTVVTLYLAA